MIIDFHTHVFPDKIAVKTTAMLSERGGIPAFTDGTVQGLLRQMEQAGVDVAVNLPVLTSPSQFESVNRFAAELNELFADQPRRLISFAGIHPDCEDVESKMKQLRESGFLGVKIHPDYQHTFINDPRYVRILECAKENDLILVTHAGLDAVYRKDTMRCPPHLARDLMDKVPHAKLVLAHMGGHLCYDQVLELLCGEDVYLDTSYVMQEIDEPTFLSLLDRHGADRILFGSDSPWSRISHSVSVLKSFAPDRTTEEKILAKNAQALLGI